MHTKPDPIRFPSLLARLGVLGALAFIATPAQAAKPWSETPTYKVYAGVVTHYCDPAHFNEASPVKASTDAAPAKAWLEGGCGSIRKALQEQGARDAKEVEKSWDPAKRAKLNLDTPGSVLLRAVTAAGKSVLEGTNLEASFRAYAQRRDKLLQEAAGTLYLTPSKGDDDNPSVRLQDEKNPTITDAVTTLSTEAAAHDSLQSATLNAEGQVLMLSGLLQVLELTVLNEDWRERIEDMGGERAGKDILTSQARDAGTFAGQATTRNVFRKVDTAPAEVRKAFVKDLRTEFGKPSQCDRALDAHFYGGRRPNVDVSVNTFLEKYTPDFSKLNESDFYSLARLGAVMGSDLPEYKTRFDSFPALLASPPKECPAWYHPRLKEYGEKRAVLLKAYEAEEAKRKKAAADAEAAEKAAKERQLKSCNMALAPIKDATLRWKDCMSRTDLSSTARRYAATDDDLYNDYMTKQMAQCGNGAGLMLPMSKFYQLKCDDVYGYGGYPWGDSRLDSHVCYKNTNRGDDFCLDSAVRQVYRIDGSGKWPGTAQ